MCNKNVKRDGKFLEEVGYGVIWVHNKQVGTYNPIPLDDGIKEVRLNVGRTAIPLNSMIRSHKVLVVGRSAAF